MHPHKTLIMKVIGDNMIKVGVMTVSGWYQVELEQLIDDIDGTFKITEKPETFMLNDNEFPLPIPYSENGRHRLSIGSREFHFRSQGELLSVQSEIFKLLDGRF